jgi:hypothetical protein
MVIILECGCGRRLQVDEERAGQWGVCPGCGREVAIPVPGQPLAAQAPAEEAAVTAESPVALWSGEAAAPEPETDWAAAPTYRRAIRRPRRIWGSVVIAGGILEWHCGGAPRFLTS